jgi:ABC-type phosphate/phosphonate transport system substrate-binding protein
MVRSGKTIRGAMFVRADSPIRNLSDLEGKTVAFVGAKNL